MRNKKSASSKNARRGAERSHQKLAEEFLARLDRTWQQHGREILNRVMAERPELYFSSAGQVDGGSAPAAPRAPEFDRRHYRADVLQRLQERKENRSEGERD